MQLRARKVSELRMAAEGKLTLFEDRAAELDWYRKKREEARRQLAFLPGYIDDLTKMIDRLAVLDGVTVPESTESEADEASGRYTPWTYIVTVLEKNSRLLKESSLPDLLRAEGAKLAKRDPAAQLSKSVTQNSKVGPGRTTRFFRVGEYVGLYEWRRLLDSVTEMLEKEPAQFESAVAYASTLAAGGMGVLQVRILLESAIEAGVLVRNGNLVGPGKPIPPNPQVTSDRQSQDESDSSGQEP